jgi:iron complex transport system substrate-binding protein
MKIILALAASLFFVPTSAVYAAQHDALSPTAPHRVVSMNVCVDQYLIALADKGQVAALSNYARDGGMSYYAKNAAAWPVTSGSVEEVVLLKPDLIIGGSARRQGPMAELRKRGVPLIAVKPAEDYKTIVKQTRLIAKAVGHPERGEALIAQMDKDLAAIPQPVGPRPVAAYYQRRGYLTGTGTLVDDIMTRAGLTNLAVSQHRKSVTQMGLETIIAAHPDYLITDSAANPHADEGSGLLFHPALMRIIPPNHRLTIPASLTVCGGPFFPQAVADLAAKVRRTEGR